MPPITCFMPEKQEIVAKIQSLARHYQSIMENFGDTQIFSTPKKHILPQKIAITKPAIPQENYIIATQMPKISTTQQTQMSQMPSVQKQEKPINKPLQNNVLFAEITNEISKFTTLEELKNYTQTKQICDIQKHASNIVFGDGNATAKILVIGEAPGQEEDLAGVPFIGRSGELLMNAFSCINLSRQKNFYITNNIFWRPPGNRKPTEEELLLCRPILNKIIEIIKPEAIICVGSVATQNILETEDSISSLRQKELTSKNFSQKIFAVYHPSYLLRNPSKKYEMYKDLLFIKSHIN